VKEGTEKRGAIESVIRIVRAAVSSAPSLQSHLAPYSRCPQLLKATPPVALPRNSKRQVSDGWAMLDAGEFAVHVVSRQARETFFENRQIW
jgi:hypothetical protein